MLFLLQVTTSIQSRLKSLVIVIYIEFHLLDLRYQQGNYVNRAFRDINLRKGFYSIRLINLSYYYVLYLLMQQMLLDVLNSLRFRQHLANIKVFLLYNLLINNSLSKGNEIAKILLFLQSKVLIFELQQLFSSLLILIVLLLNQKDRLLLIYQFIVDVFIYQKLSIVQDLLINAFVV